jgi:hypothetical protein
MDVGTTGNAVIGITMANSKKNRRKMSQSSRRDRQGNHSMNNSRPPTPRANEEFSNTTNPTILKGTFTNIFKHLDQGKYHHMTRMGKTTSIDFGKVKGQQNCPQPSKGKLSTHQLALAEKMLRKSSNSRDLINTTSATTTSQNNNNHHH